MLADIQKQGGRCSGQPALADDVQGEGLDQAMSRAFCHPHLFCNPVKRQISEGETQGPGNLRPVCTERLMVEQMTIHTGTIKRKTE